MICELCGFDNSPAAKACGKCGTPLTHASTYSPNTGTPGYYPPEHAPPGKASATNQHPTYTSAPGKASATNQSAHIYTPPPGQTSTIGAAPVQSAPPAFSPQKEPHTPNAQHTFTSSPTFSNQSSQLPRPSLPLKKIALTGVAILLLIIIAVFLIPILLNNETDSALSNSIEFFRDADSLVVSINNDEKLTINGEALSWQISIDASKAAALTDYDPVTGGTLWFVTASGSSRIADNVLDFILADSGDGVAYLTDFDHRLDSATLYLFDTTTERGTLVTNGAMYIRDSIPTGYLKGLCISPDGKSVGFAINYDSRFNSYTGYIQVDGRQEESLGDQTYAVAISNGGRNVYYMFESADGDVSLYVKSGRDETRLLSGTKMDLPFVLNASYSEAVFTDIDGRSFIWRDGGESERLNGPALRRFILPENTPFRSHFTPYFVMMVDGAQSFSGRPALTDDGLVYYNDILESIRVPNAGATDYSSIDNDAFISNDGKTLIFTNNSGHLISLDPTSSNLERMEIAREVSHFVASKDGRTVYYVDTSSVLWHYRGDNAPHTRISEDVAPESLIIASNSGSVFYLTNFRTSTMSGELFYSDNGGNATKIPGGDNVVELWRTPTSVFFRTFNNVLFRSNGSGTFEPFHEFIG